MKIVEIRRSLFKREVFIFGHRVMSFLRMWNILESIMKDVGWLVAYRSMKQRGLELPADCHLYWSERNELVEIPVGDLKRVTIKGVLPLEDTMLVRYLKSGDESVIRDYYGRLAEIGGLSKSSVDSSVEQSKALFDRMSNLEYDPSICCIVVNERNEIIDGYHRSSCVLARYGREHRVKVLRLLTDVR